MASAKILKYLTYSLMIKSNKLILSEHCVSRLTKVQIMKLSSDSLKEEARSLAIIKISEAFNKSQSNKMFALSLVIIFTKSNIKIDRRYRSMNRVETFTILLCRTTCSRIMSILSHKLRIHPFKISRLP